MRKLSTLFLAFLVVLAIVLITSMAQEDPTPEGPGLTEEQQAALDTATRLSGISFPFTEKAARGCPACHVLANEETGAYTLSFEAHERTEARGYDHPNRSHSGTSIKPTDDVNVTVCLECHASAEDGAGVDAPLSLRDIVHPAHMGSQYFKLHYGGSCFSCHNVDNKGDWQLLTEAVDVNEKGVPNPDLIPIPGAVDIVSPVSKDD